MLACQKCTTFSVRLLCMNITLNICTCVRSDAVVFYYIVLGFHSTFSTLCTLYRVSHLIVLCYIGNQMLKFLFGNMMFPFVFRAKVVI